ncbi:MAG: hypoxanthine phosphoribosyltransferase [Armatimonadetes bacterium]|nr:hypoxanthine phosphoribosyltransferase [Armatimonadota bacterium]
MTMLPPEVARVFISEDGIRRRVHALAAEIDATYAGDVPTLVSVLKGSLYFLADLTRALRCRHRLDFMAITAYGSSQAHTGSVRLLKDLDEEIAGRPVLLVDDVIDTGLTVAYLTRLLRARQPSSFRICTLLDKRVRRISENLPISFVGFEAPDVFLVGYGLDYRQTLLNLPYIGVLRQELINA